MNRIEFETKITEKAWNDESFKKELLTDTKAVMGRELGQQLPAEFKITVLEESKDQSYFVLQRNPAEMVSSGELTDEALAVAAGGAAAVLAGRWWVLTS